MDDDLRNTVDVHSQQIRDLRMRQQAHDDAIEELKRNDAVILERLERSATKDDIGALHLAIEKNVSGLLGDALRARPAEDANRLQRDANRIAEGHTLWVAIGAIIAVIAAVIAIVAPLAK